MENIILESVKQAHSYQQYRQRIKDLLTLVKEAGSEQQDPLIHYTILNETRMDRLEKTLEIPADEAAGIKKLKNDYTWLVISEGWCGDAAQLLPVIKELADLNNRISLKIVLRDENEDLMNLFLTNGSKSIPILIVLDEKLRVLASWGPRPKGAADLIARHKAEKGTIDEDAKTELQMWYLHDKGHSTAREIADMMGRLES